MERLQIYKVGGNVIDDGKVLLNFLQSYHAIEGNKILVHGGGKRATELMQSMGLEVTMVDGRRVTDKNTLDIVTMVYGGLINKNIVAQLQKLGCNAIGLSGADGNSILANKRAAGKIDYGWVGDPSIDGVNVPFINTLIQNRLYPVFCALTHDAHGHLLNTNADTIASVLAMALVAKYEVSLIYCFEKNGVLRNVEDENSWIPLISRKDYEQLKEDGVIFAGMLPKLENAFHAIAHGVKEVVLCSPENINNPEVRTVLCEQ